MEIRIQVFDNVYCLQLGRKTKWASSSSFITIEQLWYGDNFEVDYAAIIYRSKWF